MNVGELLELLQNAMDKLKGQDIREVNADQLINDAAYGLSCVTHPLSAHDRRLWCDINRHDADHFKEIPIAEFRPQYGKDKRTCDGLGYQIKHVEIVLTRDLPKKFEIGELSRWLRYAAACEQRQTSLKNIEALEQQIAAEREMIQKMQEIMDE